MGLLRSRQPAAEITLTCRGSSSGNSDDTAADDGDDGLLSKTRIKSNLEQSREGHKYESTNT